MEPMFLGITNDHSNYITYSITLTSEDKKYDLNTILKMKFFYSIMVHEGRVGGWWVVEYSNNNKAISAKLSWSWGWD